MKNSLDNDNLDTTIEQGETILEKYKAFFQSLVDNTVRDKEEMINLLEEEFDKVPKEEKYLAVYGLISIENIEMDIYKKIVEKIFLTLDIDTLLNTYLQSEKVIQSKYNWNISEIIVKSLKSNWANSKEFFDFIPWEIFDCIFKSCEYKADNKKTSLDIEWTLEYVSYMLQKLQVPLSHQYISHLSDEIENPNGILSIDSREKAKKIFEKYRENLPDVDLSIYSDFIRKINKVGQEEQNGFDDFIEDVLRYREKNGILPEEICDFLIKLKINQKDYIFPEADNVFEIDIYRGIIEDKAKYVFEKRGLNKYSARIEEPALKNRGEHFGNCSAIAISNELLDIFVESGSPLIFITLFHEVKHGERIKLFESKKYKDIMDYHITKEMILQMLMPNFYENNRANLGIEIEAEISGIVEALTYIKCNLQIPFELQNFGTRTEEELRNNLENRKKVLFNKVSKHFNKVIQRVPNILNLYPIFQLEYNSDGSYKTKVQLLEEKKLIETLPLGDERKLREQVNTYALSQLSPTNIGSYQK